jgi:hypothetical protein
MCLAARSLSEALFCPVTPYASGTSAIVYIAKSCISKRQIEKDTFDSAIGLLIAHQIGVPVRLGITFHPSGVFTIFDKVRRILFFPIIGNRISRSRKQDCPGSKVEQQRNPLSLYFEDGGTGVSPGSPRGKWDPNGVGG